MHLITVYQKADEPRSELEATHAKFQEAGLTPLAPQDGEPWRGFTWLGEEAPPKALKRWLIDYSGVEWVHLIITPDGPQVYDDSSAILQQ